MKKHLKLVFILFSSLFVLIPFACHEAPPPSPPLTTEYNGPYGTVTGKFTTPSGDALSGVTVSIISGFTNMTTVVSDTSGCYIHTKVPTGNITLKGKKGNFSSTVNVSVSEADTVEAPNVVIYPKNKLAYVEGTNDKIQDLITQLGYQIDSLDIYDIGDSYMFNINEYSALFLNCGVLETDSVVNNLLRFVRDGGMVYASDWSYCYLKKLFPGRIDFDESGDQQEITAQIIDSTLIRNLGKSEIQIKYNLSSWSTITYLDQSYFVEMMRGTYVTDFGIKTDKPIAVYCREGEGLFVFTTFHNESNAASDMLNLLEEFIFF